MLADRGVAARGRLVLRIGRAVAIMRGVHTGRVAATLWPECAAAVAVGRMGRVAPLPLSTPEEPPAEERSHHRQKLCTWACPRRLQGCRVRRARVVEGIGRDEKKKSVSLLSDSADDI